MQKGRPVSRRRAGTSRGGCDSGQPGLGDAPQIRVQMRACASAGMQAPARDEGRERKEKPVSCSGSRRCL